MTYNGKQHLAEGIMNVKKIAVIGAGAMGNGIAQVGIMAEYTVSMHDVGQRCSCYKK
jgi:3-hydroxyacyl-CoA dehydrogenase, NAD binding domain